MVAAPPLLRALIIHLIGLTSSTDRTRCIRVIDVILDELRTLDVQPLHIAFAQTGPAAIVCKALAQNPGSTATLERWASDCAVSAKTLARDFQNQTGMTFGRWRQQLRLMAALERLGSGSGVTTVAMELGYSSPSAFSAMFRHSLGKAPSRYFDG